MDPPPSPSPLCRGGNTYGFLRIRDLPLGCVLCHTPLPLATLIRRPSFHPIFCPKPVHSSSQSLAPPFAWGLRSKLLVPSLMSAHSPNSAGEAPFPRHLICARSAWISLLFTLSPTRPPVKSPSSLRNTSPAWLGLLFWFGLFPGEARF